MKRFTRTAVALASVVGASAVGIAIAAPAAIAQQSMAQQSPAPTVTPNADAEVLLRAAIEQLVLALGQALRDAPRYAVPELKPNGDILLHRLNPPTQLRPDHAPRSTLDEAAT